MEQLKKRRTIARSAFTKALVALNNLLKEDTTTVGDLTVAYQLLEKKMCELDIVQEKLNELFFDSETVLASDIEKDAEECDAYSTRFLTAKFGFNARMEKKVNDTAASPVNSTRTASSDNMTPLNLPKVQFTRFSGDLKEWLKFWSLFKKVHEDNKIDKADKFQYLILAVKPESRAANLVLSFPPTSENYDKVIASLKERFGREDLLVEVYVRELLQLVIKNAMKSTKDMPICTLYDKIETQLRALESLNVKMDKSAAMLLPLVESCLTEELLRAWQRSSTARNVDSENAVFEEPKDRLTRLITFLGSEVQNELRITMAKEGFDLESQDAASFRNDLDSNGVKRNKEHAHVREKNISSAKNLLTTKRRFEFCIFCNSEHESAKCERARSMSLSDRQNAAKNGRACLKCLKIGHIAKKCRVYTRCSKCTGRHTDLMCFNREDQEAKGEDASSARKECNLANISRDPEVVLQTLRVKLYNKKKEFFVRVIIDSGSQKSYITKKAAALIGYDPVGELLVAHSLFGGKSSDAVKHKQYKVHLSSLNDAYSCNFTALDQDIICDSIPSIKSGAWCDELSELNIKITDMNASDETVSILIGADIAGKLLTGKRHVLKCGLVAIETYLGWTVMGSALDIEERTDARVVATTLFVNTHKVADLWSLDVLGIKDPIETKTKEEYEKEICENFLKSVTVNKEGRYEVKLPWLESHPAVGDNKSLALQRLQSTVKKLKIEGFYKGYDAVFEEWLAEGVIERVSEEDEQNWGHYLPHRHVIKEDSTTKIRPVFDASAKERGSSSINECLEKGPNLISLISSTLLRFREGKLGVVADVKKAFLQISLNKNDRDFLRFFWYDKEGKIIIFRHCRVVFGVSCSPFILGAVISLHLNKIIDSIKSEQNNTFSKSNIVKLVDSLYVDNCVTSVNTIEELNNFIIDAKTAMDLAGFDLRGWEYTNDNSSENKTAVLGLVWDKQRDCLLFKVPTVEEIYKEKLTKRSILAVAHKIFDPLGFASPVLLYPRLLLQETWAQKLSWDEEVSGDIKRRFFNWLDNFNDLRKIEIPRCLIEETNIDSNNISIHTFCDASKLAYAAVVYVRIERESNVQIRFIQSKSRVAPTKEKSLDARQSIPRLELLAATIGVRLTASVLEALRWENVKVFYWSDSSTVLAWIRRENNWATFVYNRVKEIREYSKPEQWSHVPGNQNPADLPSRGSSTKQLLDSRWWEGPDWLRMNAKSWPRDEGPYDEDKIDKELKKSVLKDREMKGTVLISTSKPAEEILFYNKFSNFDTIKRVIAWLKRFCHNCKVPLIQRKGGYLSSKELEDAEVLLIKIVQKECFKDFEKDTRIKHLQPLKDNNSLIRINTKIVLRKDTYNFRCPIILPGDHYISKLIIKNTHIGLNHAGVEITLSNIREKYWILGGRRAIRSVIHKCVQCRRHDAKPLESVPVPLPVNRIREAAVFEVVGVDFTGPLYLKGGQKAWVCLFTCAVFRAVHLELVTSLSTAALLMALRRLISRRGRPSYIYSDNGTNFVGLNNAFKDVNFYKLAEFAATKQIDWKFNPPSAAWWGGFWERLNGILKQLLRKTLRRSCLDYEEMLTILLDCEAIINSRPITFMADNDKDVIPLTPSMFLHEIKEVGVLDLDNIEVNKFKRRYVYRQKIKNDLRHRFRSEYLGALVHKRGNVKNNIQARVGDVVLVQDENSKRVDWPLALVTEVIAGKDNNIRVVRLKTAFGEMVRPIQRIYPLEVNYDNASLDVDKIIVDKYKDLRKISNEFIDDNNFENNAKENVITKCGRLSKRPNRLTYY